MGKVDLYQKLPQYDTMKSAKSQPACSVTLVISHRISLAGSRVSMLLLVLYDESTGVPILQDKLFL